jgi:hypothetical protein
MTTLLDREDVREAVSTLRSGAARKRHVTLVAVLLALVSFLIVVPRAEQASLHVPKAVALPEAPGSPGKTVGGVSCAPGVRQVPWSAYSPICLPAWHGNNGGSTSKGVTGSTITVTYRNATSSELSLLYSFVPPEVIGTNDEAAHTLQSYANLFDKYYELWGRHVVIVPYTGQGNFINEDIGVGQEQAQADATTVAAQIGAFADMSLLGSSVMYAQALQDQGVVVYGLYVASQSWYREGAPYEYTVGPDCTKSAEGVAGVLGRALGGTDAIFAGDPQLRSKERTYGILYPQEPVPTTCAEDIEKGLAEEGHPVDEAFAFSFDLSKLSSELNLAVAAMKMRGVTTVIFSSSDPLTPILLFEAAERIDYHPEWFIVPYFALPNNVLDMFAQAFMKAAPDESGGMIGMGSFSPPRDQQEAIKAYEMANGGSTAGILPSYVFAYSSMLQLFEGLQAAGPDLTPGTLAAGYADSAELPPSTGMFGKWTFGPGSVDPDSSFELSHWSNDQISPINGKAGSFVACEGSKSYLYSNLAAGLPSHTQLSC